MVTNYTPTQTYSYNRLKKYIYLVDAVTAKIIIDSDTAFVSGLTQTPVILRGFNISYNEEESLDERFQFNKSLKISVNGYANVNALNGRYYVIITTEDGTMWLSNPDFPAKVTHTFTLSSNSNQTDFTFSVMSNYPTLHLSDTSGFGESSDFQCVGYNAEAGNSKPTLKLIDNNNAALSLANSRITLYNDDNWKDVHYLDNTFSLTEEWDGQIATDTISFNINLDRYKPSWSYNLIEFLQNLYAAKINDYYFAGFNLGLQPQFTIDGESNANSVISVKLTETSEHGLVAAQLSGDTDTTTYWNYIEMGSRCVGTNTAQYLLQQETDAKGNPTGRYKAYTNCSSDFPSLNIIGEFSEYKTFYSQTCEADFCSMNTNLPNTIFFYDTSCKSYTVSGSCNWSFTSVPSYMTVSPISGAGGSSYNVSICNNTTPGNTAIEPVIKLNYGQYAKMVNIIIQNQTTFVRPQIQNINCNAQDVSFTYDPTCPITVRSIDSSLSYTISNGVFKVTVPKNTLTSGEKTYNIVVGNSCNNTATQNVYIVQDKVYEQWLPTSQYICYSGSSYQTEMLYTGATSGSVVPAYPTQTRRGELITSGDSRCQSSIKQYQFNDHYYCISGNKVKAMEQMESNDGGITWHPTGLSRLGETVESASSWCNASATTKWELTDKSQCGDGQVITYTFEYRDGRRSLFQDVPASGGSYTFNVTSLKNTGQISFGVESGCSWTHVSANTSAYTVTVDANDDVYNGRECYVELKQRESNKLITLNVVQPAGSYNCEPMLADCCSANEYDIQLGGVSGATASTSILMPDGAIRLTSSLPSWLGVAIHESYVQFSSKEDFYGSEYRYYTCEFAKVTGSSAYCDTATVTVRQIPQQTPTSPYVFRFSDGTTYKSFAPSNASGTSGSFYIISTISGSSVGFYVDDSERPSWLHYSKTNTPATFTVWWDENFSSSSRFGKLTLYQNDSGQHINVEVNQSAGAGETYLMWADTGHPESYSATVSYNGTLTVNFLSKVDGYDANCTLSANTDWITTWNQAYYNYNEVVPGVNSTIYFNTNYNLAERTGIVLLKQIGTNDTIHIYVKQQAYQPDCKVTSFSIANEVCIGQALSYEYTVGDPRCTDTYWVRLYQGEEPGEVIQLKSSSVPVNGFGSGSFPTASLTAGTALVTTVVNGQQIRKYVDVVNCGQPSIYFTFSNTGSSSYDVMTVKVWLTDGSIKTWYNISEDVAGGHSETVRLYFDMSLLGKTVSTIRVNDTVVSFTGITILQQLNYCTITLPN